MRLLSGFRRAFCAILLSVALLSGALASGAFAAEKPYANDELASAAIRLQEQVGKDSAGLLARTPLPEIRKQAIAAGLKGDIGRTMPLLAAIVAAQSATSADWLLFARASLTAAAANASEESAWKDQAAAAAYEAFLLARGKPETAAALTLLGEIYAGREIWRPALDAYRASLLAVEAAPVRKTYDALREKYGFRVLDYKVDNESTNPRVCFHFSEDLARGRTDFAPFVAVAGASNAAISNEAQQICVEGLKHGESYAIVLRQGLPSDVGEALLKAQDYQIYVRDRSPQARFSGRTYVLPRLGPEGVPVVSVNTSQIRIDILRVGDRNLLLTLRSDDFMAQLSSYRWREYADRDGAKVWSGSLAVKPELNRDVTTDFPVLEAVGKLQPGVYLMRARAADDLAAGAGDEDSGGMSATQWFVVSDLGLTALTGNDGLTVLALSLASAEPIAGAEIRLLARDNEVLGTQKTDAAGQAHFDPGLSRGTGGLAPGAIVASLALAGDAADYNFLDLQQSPFDLTDRGVKGREAPKALDALVFAERGVYRSGETVYLTALLRDASGASVAGAPLTLVIKRPDGVEYKRIALDDLGLGGHSLALPLLSGAATGTWTAQVFADPKSPAIGETRFLVEDYQPERMDMVLAPKAQTARSGQSVEIPLNVRYLYGAPGAGLDISGTVEIEAAGEHGLPALKGYEAGLVDEDFSAVQNEIDNAPATDAKGEASVKVAIPDVKPTRPLQAKITLRASEKGGRAIERLAWLPLLPPGGLIGVKKNFGAGLSDGATASFDLIALDANGRRAARPKAHWSLYRVSNDYQWYKQDGRWNYEQVAASSRVADGAVDIGATESAKIAAPVALGHYRLDLKDDVPGDLQTSITFNVGWSGEARTPTPDLLDVTLDRPAYAPGETIRLKAVAHDDAKATLAIIGDKARAFIRTDLKKGDNEIALPVGKDWGSGAYALALAHRPLDKAASRNPGRALGLAWFAIDPVSHKIDVTLQAPEKIRPREKLTLPVELHGLAAGEEAYVSVAAVDIGILNLTHYQAPDPRDYFFGQRALATEIRDIYGLLIDGMQGARGAIRSGGDGGGPDMDAEKPTQEPLALYSGVVRVGADGKAEISFDIPAFNGAMRLNAVAWSKARVGSASVDVTVRDPVVVQATLPRFLSLGDQSQFNVLIDNVEGAPGAYRLEVESSGAASLAAGDRTRVLQLAAGQRTSLAIPLQAAGVGLASLELKLTGPHFSAIQTLPLKVEPGTSALYRRSLHVLQPGESLVLSDDLLAEFVPGTGAVAVAAAPLSGVDAPALLQALDLYPFGCSEQIVSRALPLLYLAKLANPGLPFNGDVAARVNESIGLLLARQDSSGSFGLWSASGSDDVWLDSYIADFLTRARENNYAVPQRAFDQTLDRLRNFVVNAPEADASNSPSLAYAIYVLARNGRPIMGDLRYLADARLAAFETPLARAQLAGALALLGDKGRSAKLFAAAADQLQTVKPSPYSRADYGSLLRDSAGLVALGVEGGASPADLIQAARFVENERAATDFTSTQEQSWMVLAAEALAQQGQDQSLSIDGAPHKGVLYRNFRGEVLAEKPVVIANAGGAPTRLVVTVSGHPKIPEPEAQHGYKIERSFFKLDGTLVQPEAIRQNDRLVVALKVTELEAAYARLILVDRLPAGLEIDNPNLFDGGSVDSLAWVKTGVEPSHAEYRDDRFVAAFDRNGQDKASFAAAYVVRAVSPGKYVLPPATIEDMYRPERFGRTAYGVVEISASAGK